MKTKMGLNWLLHNQAQAMLFTWNILLPFAIPHTFFFVWMTFIYLIICFYPLGLRSNVFSLEMLLLYIVSNLSPPSNSLHFASFCRALTTIFNHLVVCLSVCLPQSPPPSHFQSLNSTRNHCLSQGLLACLEYSSYSVEEICSFLSLLSNNVSKSSLTHENQADF